MIFDLFQVKDAGVLQSVDIRRFSKDFNGKISVNNLWRFSLYISVSLLQCNTETRSFTGMGIDFPEQKGNADFLCKE